MVSQAASVPIRTRARYYAQRWGWLAQGIALRSVMGFAERPPQIDPSVVQRVHERYRELIDRDLDNAARGLYPPALLTDMPSRRRLPAFFAEVPRSRARRQRKQWNDLPEEVDTRQYPPYYRRTFHWQSDGWFSRRSAYIYDVSVEVLFLGSADVMRRQVLPHVVREARRQDGPSRVLDAACGTGRFLGQMARVLPENRYTGLDLSAWYLQEARSTLDHVDHLSLVEDNAECMSIKDDTFDISTSIYLFHELPPRARLEVLKELKRVTAPGGLVVLMDAVQIVDHPWLEPV
ncbi:MAG: class I SAM-dependent methyltransferase, partial [Myxococcota bacterium]